MNILYLTWGETPRSYGVFGSQVISQFVENSKVSSDLNYYFASGVPIVHSGIIREKWNYFKEIKKISSQLGTIPFYWIPIFASQNFVNSSKVTFGFMHCIANRFLEAVVRKVKPDVIHCRSYHAAWAAFCLRRRLRISYKIIFDARSLWPEAVSLVRGYKNDGRDYRFLKRIENILLRRCDVTIAVSDPMREYFVELKAKKVQTIYLSADTATLAYEANTSKVKSQTINFCYLGALGEGSWHQTGELKKLFTHLKIIYPDAYLTIITTSNHSYIRNEFQEYGACVRITSTKNVRQLKRILMAMDFGLLSYFNPRNEEEIRLSATVLAVKTAEYLVSGLPVIVNDRCGGAKFLVDNFNLGISYSSKNFDSLTKNAIDEFIGHQKRQMISCTAINLFSSKKNAVAYNYLYTL